MDNEITTQQRHATVDDLLARLQELSAQGHGNRSVQIHVLASGMSPFARHIGLRGTTSVLIRG